MDGFLIVPVLFLLIPDPGLAVNLLIFRWNPNGLDNHQVIHKLIGTTWCCSAF
jgi:hypothetical protein